MSSNALSTLALPEPDMPVMTTSSVPRGRARRSAFLRLTDFERRFDRLRAGRRGMSLMLSVRYARGKSAQRKRPRAGEAGSPNLGLARGSRHRVRRGRDRVDAIAHLRHNEEHQDERSRQEYQAADAVHEEKSVGHL